jgi:hypothetical protein
MPASLHWFIFKIYQHNIHGSQRLLGAINILESVPPVDQLLVHHLSQWLSPEWWGLFSGVSKPRVTKDADGLSTNSALNPSQITEPKPFVWSETLQLEKA